MCIECTHRSFANPDDQEFRTQEVGGTESPAPSPDQESAHERTSGADHRLSDTGKHST